MDKTTHSVRAKYWKKIIKNCCNRPKGMTAKQWLENNGISEPTYYAWMKRFRQETYELATTTTDVPAVSEVSAITFAEIPVKAETTVEEHTPVNQEMHPVAVISTGTCSIAISNDISDLLISKILQEVCHA